MEESTNNWIFIAIAGGAAIAGVLYFLNKKSDKKTLIETESLDMISLEYVKNYFKNTYNSIVKENSTIVPVVLKIHEKDMFVNNDNTSYPHYLALSYYDKNTSQVLEEHTKCIRAKKMDINLTDAFGDKDMLILK